ncbi:MAG: NfeD family protein [Salinivirgaceae bacterium]|jgi:membrane-bound ClpP family serine protease|nr:NfeD family protein [Salinivirgaceae bacterium]
MSLTAIIFLLVLGLVLILFEFLVLPGANIPGIIGILLILSGIYFGYKSLDLPAGHIILVSSFVVIFITIVLILRSNTWKKMALNTSIDGKIENTETKNIAPGDKGKSLTRLAPIGIVMVNNLTFEGKSGHKFIDANTPIEVIKIERNQLIVKPIE